MRNDEQADPGTAGGYVSDLGLRIAWSLEAEWRHARATDTAA